MNRLRVMVASVVLLALGGCCGPSEIDECNQLIQAINNQKVDFEDAGDDPAQAAAKMREFAQKARASQKGMGEIKLTSEKLSGFAGQYGQMLGDVADKTDALAEVLDDVAGKLEKKDVDGLEAAQKKMEEAQKEFQAAVDKEDPIVDGINNYCQSL